MSFRERKSRIERTLESAGNEVVESEHHVEEIGNKLQSIESAISKVFNDAELSEKLEKNRNEREREKQDEERNAQVLLGELDFLLALINEGEEANSKDAAALEDLRVIGEDVSDAERIVEERETWARETKQKIDELMERLGIKRTEQTLQIIAGKRLFDSMCYISYPKYTVKPDIPQLENTAQSNYLHVGQNGESYTEFDHPTSLAKSLSYKQGINEYGFEQDCGLASIAGWLNIAGSAYTENDVVKYAASHHNLRGETLCDTFDNPSECGGTVAEDRAKVWSAFGISAKVYRDVFSYSDVDKIADYVEQGRAVSVGVNAFKFWNTDNPEKRNYFDCYGDGGSNHVINVVSIRRNSMDNSVTGFFVNDMGRGLKRDAVRFVPINDFKSAYQVSRGSVCVSDKPIW